MRLALLSAIIGLCATIALAQNAKKPASPVTPRPSPQMERLIKTFSGTWSIVLKLDPNEQMPKGGSGSGEVVWRPGPGGLSLIEEYHSIGDEGELSGLGVVWWDKDVQRYQVVWCDSSTPQGCMALKHGAQWEDAQLVAIDEPETAGKRSALREVFSNITKNSYTQTIYAGESASDLRQVLTITATRRATLQPMQPNVFTPRSHPVQTQSLNMPGPAVQNYMLGTWSLALNYEPSPEFPNGAAGQGTEVWWAGPGGYSVVEEYYQNDANEHVEEFSPAWWDTQAGGQRFLYCGNTAPDGCYISKGVFRWEGNNLVFREERKRDKEKLSYSLVFKDITPSSFTQINEESVSGKPAQPTLTIRATKVVQTSEQTSDAQRSVDEIKTTLATLIKFQLKYDVDAVDKLLDPEFLYVSNDGLIVSRVEFINLTDREKNPLEVLEVTDVQVQLSGDTAVATGIIHEKGLLYGKPYEFRGRTLITYARRSGRWLCLAIHD